MRTGVRVTHISRALAEQPAISGVDYRFVILYTAGTVIFTMLLKMLYLPLVTLFVHMLFKQLNKADPFMSRVIIPYSRQGGFYQPFPRFSLRRFDRPNGFGRNQL